MIVMLVNENCFHNPIYNILYHYEFAVFLIIEKSNQRFNLEIWILVWLIS